MKFLTYNRRTFVYSMGNKVVTPKEFWFAAKHLIVNKPGCLCQDDKNVLMYEL